MSDDATPSESAHPRMEPGPSGRVNMRWQGAAGWVIATGFCLYFAAGLTVAAIVTAVATGQLGATVVLAVLALLFGL
ncbi:hypothetical protein ACFQ07_14395, partial [Actinomadura adrarensis]